MLLKNFTEEQLNRTIERNLNRYNYDKKGVYVIKGFGYNNYFINPNSEDDYILKDIPFNENTSFLLIDDIGLQALIELHKLGITNITLCASSKEILNCIKLALKTTFINYNDLQLFLIDDIKNNNYDIIINTSNTVFKLNYNYYCLISTPSKFKKYFNHILYLNDLQLSNGCINKYFNFYGNYYRIILTSNETNLFENEDDFINTCLLNTNVIKVLNLNRKNQPISFKVLNDQNEIHNLNNCFFLRKRLCKCCNQNSPLNISFPKEINMKEGILLEFNSSIELNNFKNLIIANDKFFKNLFNVKTILKAEMLPNLDYRNNVTINDVISLYEL